MAPPLIRRLGQSLGLLLLVSIVSFLMLRLLPGDFAEHLLTMRMDGDMPTPEAVAAFKRSEGLDAPLPVQYLRWLGGVLQGDLGTSFHSEDAVAAELGLRLRNSLLLGAAGMGVSLLLAVPLGILAALRKGGWADRLAMTLAVAGMSLPNFWFAFLLIIAFALHLDWLPVVGFGTAAHVVLPAAVVGLSLAGVTARLIRASLLGVLGADYIRTARAMGAPRGWVLLRHAAPNALIPVVTVLGLQAGKVFDSIVVVEVVFAWPGLGRLLVEAIQGRDFPVMQACVLAIGAVYVLANLAVDALNVWIDPRMRVGL